MPFDFEQALKPAEDQNNNGQQQDNSQQQQQAAPAAGAPADPVEGAAASASAGAANAEDDNKQLPNPNTPPPAGAQQGNAQQQEDVFTALDRMSGGKIKDEAAFTSFLPIIDEYPTLKKQHEELAARMAQAPVFADDEVRIFNELKANGATKEQINTFLKLGQYGDLKELSDRDAIIAKMVMVDGTKESAAGYKLDKEFKVGDESLDEQEREMLDDDMRLKANEARKELDKFKSVISKPGMEPEEVQLQRQAQVLAHQATVKPYVSEVISTIPHLGVFNVAAKDAKDAIPFEIPLDDATRTQLGTYVENYFMDGLTPVTEESTREALNYARAEYFRTNAENIFRSLWTKAVTETTEAMVKKYENRSGLEDQQENPLIHSGNGEGSMAQFMNNVANRKVG